MSAYAIVTGASKGIGRSIATELAKRGYNLLLVARSGTLLNQLATELEHRYKIKVSTLAADLSSPEALNQIRDLVVSGRLPVCVLVNNAGYGVWGQFSRINLRSQLSMLRLNNESLVALTYELLPVLQQQPRSYILNVASTTAYQAVPYMSVYAASKSFVVSFSRGLAAELQGTSTTVTCLSPGSTDTNFMETAGMNSPRLIRSSQKVSMTPDEVARQGVAALFKGRTEFIPGAVNKVTAYANALLPKKLIERIAAGIYKPE